MITNYIYYRICCEVCQEPKSRRAEPQAQVETCVSVRRKERVVRASTRSRTSEARLLTVCRRLLAGLEVGVALHVITDDGGRDEVLELVDSTTLPRAEVVN